VALIAFGVAVTSSLRSADEKTPFVVIETSMGTIKLELFQDKSPTTVKNFLQYVDDKFYDGTIFHRVMPGFMIQGGGMEPGLREKKTRSAITNEASNGVANKRGTVAMARQDLPNTATSQFFINLKDNTHLDKNARNAGYCVFAKVVDGMEVVDKIAGVETSRVGPHEAVPRTDVVVKSIRRADK
jgi:cyclophilin family peptidyl-prolyl cis-trans isomerase